jgi:putative membrane protein
MPSEGARLHPASILVGVPLVQIVRILLVPTIALIAGRGVDRALPFILAFGAFALAARIASWSRFRWAYDGDVLAVEQGVLARRRRVVAAARVQQVELDRPFLQRLLGLATLRIETAGSDAGPEVELRVLGATEAIALRDALQPPAERAGPTGGTTDTTSGEANGDGTGAAGGDAVEQVVLTLPLGRVALASVTGAQLLVAPALLAGALQFTGDRTDELIDAGVAWLTDVASGGALPSGRLWLTGAALLLVVSVVTTVVVAVVRDGGFTVVRAGDDLVLRRGLLGTRESTVPLRRVQVVRVTANPLRRMLGFASLRIHSAGGSAGGSSGASERRAVVPLVADRDVVALLTDLLPDLAGSPPLAAHPPAARRRAAWRRLRGLAGWFVPASVGWALLARAPEASPVPLPVTVLDLLARPTAAWSVPVVLGVTFGVLQLGLARLEYAALAHGIDGRVLVARSGALARTFSVAPLARLQGVTQRATWFQARRDLATVWAHVAGPGGDVVVRDVGTAAADALQHRIADAAAGAAVPREA